MSCLGFFAGKSPIHRLDPRVRLLSAAALAVTMALSLRYVTMGSGLGLAVLMAVVARLDGAQMMRRMLHLNAFLLFLWLVLPWSVPGDPAGWLGGVMLTEAGIRLALSVTLKGNAIAILFTALVGTIDPGRLGCALKSLALPDPLVHLFTLTIRYTDTIHDEYSRLRRAMQVRAFQPGFSLHALRMYGYLVGLLLVRGVERGERVLAAMKCRGFDGRFHTLEGFALRRADLLFAGAVLCLVYAWLWMEKL